MTKIRSYSELSQLDSFEDRFEYLKLGGDVGLATFGFDRYVNQVFYTSYHWRKARNDVILRDLGRNLGVYGHDIHGQILVHHMNPIVLDDIVNGEEWITDPEFLVCTNKKTHNAIHFGREHQFPEVALTRSPSDTTLWGQRSRT
jgi:hypothetical protein